MSSEDDNIRQRIYQAYRLNTVDTTSSLYSVSLGKILNQYRIRWKKFLPVDRDAPVLDIGCGGGEFLLFLLESGYKNVEGIDVSPDQIQKAKDRGLENVFNIDATSYLSANPKAYQLINIQNVLEHLTKPELFDLLNQIVQVLEPSGLMFGVVPNAKSIMGARVRYADVTHELSFTPESIRQMFEVVGLKVISLQEHGPIVHGIFSLIRWCAWQLIRLFILIYLIAEGGDYQDRIYTHNLMFVAQKK